MAEPIQIEVEFTGAAEAARAADTVSGRLDNMSNRTDSAARSADRLAAQQTAAATSAIAFGQRLAAAASAVQGLVSSLGIEGQTAGLIGRVTQTSTAMAQLGASFGPQGALVGGILGAAIPAIQALSEEFNSQGAEIQALREQANQLVESYDNILARIQQVNSERTRESRLAMGLGSAAEQQAFVEQRQQQENAARLRVEAALMELNRASVSEYDTAAQNLRAAEDAQRAASQQLTQAREAQRQAVADAEGDAERLMEELLSAGSGGDAASGGARRGGSRRRAETPQAAAVDEGDAMAVVRDIIREQNDALREQAEIMEQLNRQKEEAQAKDAQIAEQRAQEAEAELDRQRELNDALIDAQEKQRDVAESQRQEYETVTGVIVGGLNDALQSIIAGNKTAGEAFEGLLAGFLKYISEQSMLKAIFYYAEAIASFARQDYASGAMNIAAGTAFTAVAVAAGAGSVALSAPSGSMAGDQKPAGPEAGAAGGDRGGGDVVINWNSPVVTAGTRAELGRDMASMIRAGSQRFGTV